MRAKSPPSAKIIVQINNWLVYLRCLKFNRRDCAPVGTQLFTAYYEKYHTWHKIFCLFACLLDRGQFIRTSINTKYYRTLLNCQSWSLYSLIIIILISDLSSLYAPNRDIHFTNLRKNFISSTTHQEVHPKIE